MERINVKDIDSRGLITKVVSVLGSGGVVIYPTETCYGIGVDLTNPEAVDKLWRFKGERGIKPVLAAMSSFEMAEKFVFFSELEKKIAQKYWPGPVSIVASSKNLVSKKAQGETDTLGVRVPDHKLVLEMINRFGKPISSTSANVSGGSNPYSYDQFLRETPKNTIELVDLFIDDGEIPRRKPSTIVRIDGDIVEVLRQGEVLVEI